MRVSLSWLKEYVDIQLDMDLLVDALTMVGLEVDHVIDRFAYLETVLVGQIKDVLPHPKADRLTLCRVDTGRQVHDIVCGAPNARPGIHAALALPGTVLPNGTEVQPSTIRGQMSYGMLCSRTELGLGEDHSGIMELDASARIGDDLATVLGLHDPVIEVDLTPNRPDCLSVIGIAREIAAIQQTPLKLPDDNAVDRLKAVNDWTSVRIEAPDLNPRYSARMIIDIKVAPSPAWLQDRLNSIGMRPINNIVDVTNFVMMETGQPLHAFDYDRLADHRIVVRTANPGETFTTLDGKERTLDPDMLMICDGEKPVAIGGVMGGLNSEIESTTTRVLLESAYFNPISIRKTAKKLGLATDASHRFERGTDPGGTVSAMNRAAGLIAEVGGGRVVEGIIDEHPRPVIQQPVTLSVDETNRLLGTDFKRDRIQALLESIQFTVDPIDPSTLQVSAPSFRVDIHRPQDLMEEVARLSGYDHIPTTFPNMPSETRRPLPAMEFRNRLKQLMIGLGFRETINYSFINPDFKDTLGFPEGDIRRNTVGLLNPLTEEQAVMRTTLLPGLLQTVYRNIAKQDRNVTIFEIGKTYFSKGAEHLPHETEMLATVWTGAAKTVTWHDKGRDCDFFDIKGALEALLESLSIPSAVFEPINRSSGGYLLPGHAAQIRISDQNLGWVGQLRPAVLAHFGIKAPVYFFELELDRFKALVPDQKHVHPLPKYPAAPRDLTIIIDKHIASARIQQYLDNLNDEWVEDAYLFDVFEGDPIPEGKKSLSYRVVYRSAERTLEEDEVSRLHQSITHRIVDKFGGALPA